MLFLILWLAFWNKERAMSRASSSAYSCWAMVLPASGSSMYARRMHSLSGSFLYTTIHMGQLLTLPMIPRRNLLHRHGSAAACVWRGRRVQPALPEQGAFCIPVAASWVSQSASCAASVGRANLARQLYGAGKHALLRHAQSAGRGWRFHHRTRNQPDVRRADWTMSGGSVAAGRPRARAILCRAGAGPLAREAKDALRAMEQARLAPQAHFVEKQPIFARTRALPSRMRISMTM